MATEDRDRRLLGVYVALRKILLDKLPIGIELPDLKETVGKTSTEASVKFARKILAEMPADPWTVGLIDGLILDWLDALYMCRQHNRRGEEIYGELADAAFTRFADKLIILNAREDETGDE